jgi:hypothetical protein
MYFLERQPTVKLENLVDVEFTVAQRIWLYGNYQTGPIPVLPMQKSRYFKNVLCIKNIPRTSIASIDRFYSDITNGADWMYVLDFWGTTWTLYPGPNDVQSVKTWINTKGRDTSGNNVTPCDPERHPLIVEFITGKVYNVNPGAMANVQTYDYYDPIYPLVVRRQDVENSPKYEGPVPANNANSPRP